MCSNETLNLYTLSTINPKYSRKPKSIASIDYYKAGLDSGDINILSELLSLAESTVAQHRDLIYQLLNTLSPAKTNSRRIVITGSPGAGKSTFINGFISNQLPNKQHKVAVVAVDPSSELSKGSILGDKTRMTQLINAENVFIRPMASGAELGGIAEATYRSILLLEAAGYSEIFIETVGVGQSSFEASKLADLFILVLSPAGGDALQGIKRGIVEMSDIIIVNKADGVLLENAQITQKAYLEGLHYYPKAVESWQTKVQMVSSLEEVGMESVQADIDAYFGQSNITFALSEKRKIQSQYWFEKETARILMDQFMEDQVAIQNYRDAKLALGSGKLSLPQAILNFKADIK